MTTARKPAKLGYGHAYIANQSLNFLLSAVKNAQRTKQTNDRKRSDEDR
jgi:hypothetical protein